MYLAVQISFLWVRWLDPSNDGAHASSIRRRRIARNVSGGLATWSICGGPRFPHCKLDPARSGSCRHSADRLHLRTAPHFCHTHAFFLLIQTNAEYTVCDEELGYRDPCFGSCPRGLIKPGSGRTVGECYGGWAPSIGCTGERSSYAPAEWDFAAPSATN